MLRIRRAGQTGQTRPTAPDYEREIESAEARLAELTELLGLRETYADGARSAATQAEYREVSARIEELYADWEEAASS